MDHTTDASDSAENSAGNFSRGCPGSGALEALATLAAVIGFGFGCAAVVAGSLADPAIPRLNPATLHVPPSGPSRCAHSGDSSGMTDWCERGGVAEVDFVSL